MQIEKSPWKVGKYKNCDDYGEASVDVDQDADVALHFLQVASIHTLNDGAQEEGDANLRGSLLTTSPRQVPRLTFGRLCWGT